MGKAAVVVRGKAAELWHLVAHPYARVFPACLIGLWFAWLLAARLDGFDPFLLTQRLADIAPHRWAIAGIATFISFAAVAGYDVVASRGLGLPITRHNALVAGFVATALAQLIGLGLATGSLVRWRMLGAYGVSLWRASVMTMWVTAGFLGVSFGLIAITALLWLDLPLALDSMAVLALLAVAALIVLVAMRPDLGVASRLLPLPKMKALRDLFGLGCLDLGFAALAFWALIPGDLGPDFLTVLPVFLLASTAGILLGTPGGIGPFELACLTLLPTLGEETLLSAIIGFRLIYFLIPGGAAIVVLIAIELCGRLPFKDQKPPYLIPKNQHLPPALEARFNSANRADVMLIHDGGLDFLAPDATAPGFLVAEVGNSLIAFGDSIDCDRTCLSSVETVIERARCRNLFPVFYKCGGQTVDMLKRAGLHCHQIGIEAHLDPAMFSLSGSPMRGLRRKLSLARRSGIRVERGGPGQLPREQMAEISADWTKQRGGERGFSMGRYTCEGTDHHHHYLAWDGAHLIGFISFWHTECEWTLDLVRFCQGAPDGTIHALVVAAMNDAKTAGIKRFSLSSVPLAGLDQPAGVPEWICRWIFTHRPLWHGAQGLFQFKQSFRPEWQPRYLAAPGLLSAGLSGLDIARAVRPVCPRPEKLKTGRVAGVFPC